MEITGGAGGSKNPGGCGITGGAIDLKDFVWEDGDQADQPVTVPLRDGIDGPVIGSAEVRPPDEDGKVMADLRLDAGTELPRVKTFASLFSATGRRYSYDEKANPSPLSEEERKDISEEFDWASKRSTFARNRVVIEARKNGESFTSRYCFPFDDSKDPARMAELAQRAVKHGRYDIDLIASCVVERYCPEKSVYLPFSDPHWLTDACVKVALEKLYPTPNRHEVLDKALAEAVESIKNSSVICIPRSKSLSNQVPDRGDQRRLMLVYVNLYELLDLLRPKDSKYVWLPQGFEGFPPDIEILDFRSDDINRRYAFTIRHPSYPVVPDGMCIPEHPGTARIMLYQYRIEGNKVVPEDDVLKNTALQALATAKNPSLTDAAKVEAMRWLLENFVEAQK